MFFVLSLALAGLFLIYLEFFLPGAVMAIGGSVLLLASIFVFHMEKPSLTLLILYLMSLSSAVFALAKFAMWRVRATAVLQTDQEGYQACLYSVEVIGKTGTATTDLKPSGNISVDGQSYQALAQNGFIDQGSEIVVVGGQGSHLIVQRSD